MNKIFYFVPLFIILVIACYTDLDRKKVYNWNTLPGMLLGFVLHAAIDGKAGFFSSLLGCGLGLGLFGIVYLMGGMGGGDVKLAGAIGALGGISLAWWCIFYSAIVGGAIAVVTLVWQGKLKQGLLTVGRSMLKLKSPEASPTESYGEIPYGVAMVIGTFMAVARELYVSRIIARIG